MIVEMTLLIFMIGCVCFLFSSWYAKQGNKQKEKEAFLSGLALMFFSVIFILSYIYDTLSSFMAAFL